jgi:hypothetical protein
MRRLQAAKEEEWSMLCLPANANLCYVALWLGLELLLLVLCELVLSLPTGLCELVLSLPYLVLLLFLFLCCCLCSCAVRRDLADVLGVLADVAMVSSPMVGKGYHSASMVGNQSTGRVSLPGLGIVIVGYQTKHPSWFLHRMVRPRPLRLRPGSPKRTAGYQSRPWWLLVGNLEFSISTFKEHASQLKLRVPMS